MILKTKKYIIMNCKALAVILIIVGVQTVIMRQGANHKMSDFNVWNLNSTLISILNFNKPSS